MINPTKNPLYYTWMNMRRRCSYPKATGWEHYGGRGITVCERWDKSFAAFVEDVGPKPSPKHTLDRYPNNDGNYEPGNVRWATRAEQMFNMRANRYIEVNGERVLIRKVAETLGLQPSTVISRIRTGRDAEAVLWVPPKHGHVLTLEEREEAWGINRRKTHCPQGHAYSPENTYTYKGRRNCRICAAERSRRWVEKKRALAHQ